MPVRARRSKRRTSHVAELDAWETLFATGYDYFDDLGFGGRRGTERARAAAADAWRRLGARFLANRTDGWSCEPWALQTFGEPPCR